MFLSVARIDVSLFASDVDEIAESLFTSSYVVFSVSIIASA